MYRLEYLPIAKQDIAEIAAYISRTLCNPTAAQHLAIELDFLHNLEVSAEKVR
jgi:plasmid stabilization system protein ParE